MNALRLKQRLWVQFPYKPEVFSSLIYIIVQVVFIVAKAAFIPYLIYWQKAISLCGEKGENVHKKDTISLRRQIWLSLAQVLNRNNDWVGTVKSTSLVAVIREGESALYIKICTLMNEVNPEDEVYLKFMYRTISRYVFTEDKPWLEDKQFSYGALAKTKPKQTNQIQFLLTLMNWHSISLFLLRILNVQYPRDRKVLSARRLWIRLP